MASYRYRAQIPCGELNKSGITASINNGKGNIVIFSKPVEDDIRLAKDVKRSGGCVITDIGDNHFNTMPHYKEILSLADYCVCPTEIMKQIQKGLGRDSVIIPDPYEEEIQNPHAQGNKLLWHGHNTNIEDIKSYLPHLNGKNLTMVTGPKKIGSALEWSPKVIKEELAKANIVLLPTRKGAEYKSPNRLVNALMSGCFPICSPHPAYDEFKQFCWVGEIVTGIRWAEHFTDDLNDLVSQGQEYCRDRFSPKVVGEKWKALLESI